MPEAIPFGWGGGNLLEVITNYLLALFLTNIPGEWRRDQSSPFKRK